MITASKSDVSNSSSFARLFDEEMLQELIIMRDMVQDMYEDRKENTILQDDLMVMKDEKQEFPENMHEMEIQLHEAKETLAKYVHENEVCSSILPSISAQNECFGAFERQAR